MKIRSECRNSATVVKSMWVIKLQISFGSILGANSNQFFFGVLPLLRARSVALLYFLHRFDLWQCPEFSVSYSGGWLFLCVFHDVKAERVASPFPYIVTISPHFNFFSVFFSRPHNGAPTLATATATATELAPWQSATLFPTVLVCPCLIPSNLIHTNQTKLD